MERLHGGQWNELHTYRTLLSGTIQCVQRVQACELRFFLVRICLALWEVWFEALEHDGPGGMVELR